MIKTISRSDFLSKIDNCYMRIENGENINISHIETTKGEVLSGEVKFGFAPDNKNSPVALIVRKQIRLTDIKSLQLGEVKYEIRDE